MNTERDSFSLRAGTLVSLDAPDLHDVCVFVSDGVVRFVGPWDERPKASKKSNVPELSASMVLPALVAFHVAARPQPLPADARAAFRARTGGEHVDAPARALAQAIDSTKRRALTDAISDLTYTYARQGVATLATSTHLASIPEGVTKIARASLELEDPICEVAPILSLTTGNVPERDLTRALEQLPKLAARGQARVVEVACGPRAFSVEAATSILERAAELDLPVALRAGFGGDADCVELALEHGARYVVDALELDPQALAKLAGADVALAITPARALTLGERARAGIAREMLDAGGAVVLSPGGDPLAAMCDDLSLTSALAAADLGMTPEEILTALTLAPARTLGIESTGVALGDVANLALFSCDDLADIPFQPGSSHCVGLVSSGRFVFWVDSEEIE